eukprot:m.127141 g.127141  ORF g.127141 m.127141 type:complete len:122 (-) comp13592_c0_seq1:67-432(-)
MVAASRSSQSRSSRRAGPALCGASAGANLRAAGFGDDRSSSSGIVPTSGIHHKTYLSCAMGSSLPPSPLPNSTLAASGGDLIARLSTSSEADVARVDLLAASTRDSTRLQASAIFPSSCTA